MNLSQVVCTIEHMFVEDTTKVARSAGQRSQYSRIPAGLDSLEPGPLLAALLSTIDVNSLSGHNAVIVLRAAQKMASHYAAQTYRSMGAIAEAMMDPDDDPHEALEHAERGAALEIRAALRLTRRSAESELEMAVSLSRSFPAVLQALTTGTIDARRARTIAHGVSHLDAAAARLVVDRVLEEAPRMTTGQLAARIRTLCVEAEPEEAKDRYQTALESRRTVAEVTIDHTVSFLILDGPPDRVAEAQHNINHIAMSLRSPRDGRTMDQLRCDVALDLLTGRTDYRTTGRGTIDLQVDVETLAGLAESPGDLAGLGPVIADIARQVAARQHDAEWRFSVIDPTTRLPIHNGTTRRRPNAAQTRAVRTRNRTCVFPGCRVPASECDIDHTEPWAHSGQTVVDHLAPGCRHDHVGRHQFRWVYQPLPAGDWLWTSPLGHVYTTSGRPPP